LRFTSLGTRLPGEDEQRLLVLPTANSLDELFTQPFLYLFKLFLLGYLILKPLIRFQFPSIRKELTAAARSAFWVWMAGLTGLVNLS
jgi:hypothetical protein